MAWHLLKWEHFGKCLQSKRRCIFFTQIKDRAVKVIYKTLPNNLHCFYSLLRGDALVCLSHGERVLVWMSLWKWNINGANHGMRRDKLYKDNDLGKPSRSKMTKNKPKSSSVHIAGSSAHWFSILGFTSRNVMVSLMVRLWKNSSPCGGCSPRMFWKAEGGGKGNEKLL